jgi:GNAT superfamily N-acetyltransferase
MTYRYSMLASEMDVDAVWNLLRETYWSPKIRRDVVERAMANSIVVGAFDEASGKQVAYARVVSDRATFAWLCDVIVHEQHRGQGLSVGMLERLFAHPELQTLRRWMLGTRDAHKLYERYGFVQISPERWMARTPEPGGWQDE